jgi:hypothetical protein
MPVVRTAPLLLALLALAACLALPAGALAQSAGDDQYTDPFGGGDEPARQEQPPPEQPAPEQPAEPAPDTSAPAPGGNGTAEAAPSADAAPSAEASQSSQTLPRTGAPVLLFAAAGYALLLAGIAIRRQT